MAEGFKDFAPGDILTAADVDDYLMRQAVMRFADASARTSALSGVLVEGMMSYLKDTDTVEVYDGSAWVGVGGVATLAASGGTEVTSGGYKYHTFTSSGTLTVSTAGVCEVLAVGGGGGGHQNDLYNAGGGGAGGLVNFTNLYLTATSHTITIGAGGTGAPNAAVISPSGSESLIGSIVTAVGGGGGGANANADEFGGKGGSGGGSSAARAGAPGVSGQGNDGGGGSGGGGGGGAGAAGVGTSSGGHGGVGLDFSTWATATSTGDSGYYAGGGGGGDTGGPTLGNGGTGGGGNAASATTGGAGSANTGGGGGAGVNTGSAGGNGGSGIVIVRYAV